MSVWGQEEAIYVYMSLNFLQCCSLEFQVAGQFPRLSVCNSFYNVHRHLQTRTQNNIIPGLFNAHATNLGISTGKLVLTG